MTERFTYKHFDWLQWHIYKDGKFFIEVTNCEEDAKNLCDLLNGLIDGNAILEKRIHIYETTLKEAIQNERTHLGHNALKQLADNLGVEV